MNLFPRVLTEEHVKMDSCGPVLSTLYAIAGASLLVFGALLLLQGPKGCAPLTAPP